MADALSLAKEITQQLRDAEAEESFGKSARDVAIQFRQAAVDALTTHRQALQEEEQSFRSLEAQLRLLIETHGEEADRSDRLAKLLDVKTEAKQHLAATRRSLTELQPGPYRSCRAVSVTWCEFRARTRLQHLHATGCVRLQGLSG